VPPMATWAVKIPGWLTPERGQNSRLKPFQRAMLHALSEDTGTKQKPRSVDLRGFIVGAGERDRTVDVQLGKAESMNLTGLFIRHTYIDNFIW